MPAWLLLSFCLIPLQGTSNDGADGERSTAQTLRPLLKRDWVLFNDIDTGHGNIDHVLVGPAGVFVLESKRLAGKIRVDAGKLVVRWHEDPHDGYENDSIASRARGAAFDLHARIADPSPWVQAVVVLWGDFGPELNDHFRQLFGAALAMRSGDASTTPLADIARLLVDKGGHAVPPGSAAQVVRMGARRGSR